MNLGLQDRTSFVAGASSGLGKAVAARLLQEGCRLAICSRSQERIRAAAEQLVRETGATPENILPLVCDVTDEGQIRAAMEQTVHQFGGLNILVANAGGPPAGSVDDFETSQWRDAIELNLMGTVNLCRAALEPLRRAASDDDGLARILMITSLSAKQPVPNLVLSNMARAGVQGFAKTLSEELGPEGITVNTILPGYTRTDRLSHLSETLNRKTGRSIEDIEAGWATSSALKRIGTEEEFAAAAAFLVSRPAGYITGIALPVDGGAVKSLL